MGVSAAFLERAAARTGFRPAALEKVIRLGELARDVAPHPLLGDVLALKGGTALNLCYGAGPTRLSVDLDFNYVGHVSRERMLEDRPRVEGAVEDLARRLGYRVQRSRDAFAGRKLYLTYRSVLGPEDRIEVDLNFLLRVPLDGTEPRAMWQPDELDRPRVRVISAAEMWIGKLLALLDRATPRDAWDVARLPELAGDVTADPLFRPRFIALAATLDHPLETYDRARLESRITDRAVAEQLVPMLAVPNPPRARELVESAWMVAGPLVALEPQEREYISGVHRGEARVELLFPGNPEAAERIAEHPAIQWKLRNVRRKLEG
jgi:predicted nucleotidyltransferase component of viral defense system